jgi:hypothetical protein
MISIKDFVGEKKNPQLKKRKSCKSNFFGMKLNTKPPKFKCGLADGGGGGAGCRGGRGVRRRAG